MLLAVAALGVLRLVAPSANRLIDSTDSALSSFFTVGGADGTAIGEVQFLLLFDSGTPVI